MAETTKSAGKKKPAAQAKPKESAQKNAPKNSKNQFWSVILFALGILIALMTVIKGSAGWLGIHNLLLGVFGVAVFAVPIILIYTALQIGMEKSQESVAYRAFWGVAMIFLASAAFQIFFVGEIPGNRFGQTIKLLYQSGTKLESGGIAGLPISGILLKVFGTLGAKLVSAVLFFVFAMLLSGLGLIDFLMMLARPFIFIGKCFKGVYSMILGGEFEEGFMPEDDLDDEKEKKAFAKDMEAIELANSRGKKSQKPKHREIVVETDPLTGGNDELSDDRFFIDIPLPDSGAEKPAETVLEKPEAPAKQPVREKNAEKPADIDDGLEMLISKAADEKAEMDERAAAGEEPSEKEEPVQKPLYLLPPIDLLSQSEVHTNREAAVAEMREKADVIKNTLLSFGVEVKIKDIFRGPSITRYEIQPGVGVKVSKIKGLEDDIALSLAAQGVRIEAPVPGKSAVGIEIPNETRDAVSLRDILQSPEFRSSKSKLTFAVGKDITGNVILGDIAKMPHVIIAGTTGSGKSVCTRSIIMSILYNATPDEVKVILIDPKIVEFAMFEGIPHLLIPIVTDVKRAAGALGWAVNEMMRRYQLFAGAGANDLKSYNELAEKNSELDTLAQIVVFIDELADMMLVAGKEVEDSICRLAQMGRAAGMHLVVATQRPTTDVITGLIKANIPSRIALSVKSQIDSRTIIDMAGADKLLGHGDMLYMPIGMQKPVRVQGCFATNQDINATLDYIKAQVTSEFDEAILQEVDSFVPAGKGEKSADIGDMPAAGTDDDYIERAIELAVMTGQLSASTLQRKLKLGYARAGRIMDELEEMGVVGPSEGAKPRKVLMSKMQYDERKLRRMQG